MAPFKRDGDGDNSGNQFVFLAIHPPKGAQGWLHCDMQSSLITGNLTKKM